LLGLRASSPSARRLSRGEIRTSAQALGESEGIATILNCAYELDHPFTSKRPARSHSALAFLPDGRTVVSGRTDGSTLRLWKGADTKSISAQTQAKAGNQELRAAVYAPEGKWLASGGDDSEVRLWSVTDGTIEEQASLNHAKGMGRCEAAF